MDVLFCFSSLAYGPELSWCFPPRTRDDPRSSLLEWAETDDRLEEHSREGEIWKLGKQLNDDQLLG
jgi:hypothetical protein